MAVPAVPVRRRALVSSDTSGWLTRQFVPPAMILVLVVTSVMLLLTPLYVHLALDLSGGAANVGLSAAQAQHYSDLTINELVFGPGTFAFAAPDGSPFYSLAERGHMADVRLVLWVFVVIAAVCAILLAMIIRTGRHDPDVRRAFRRGALVLVVGTVAAGIFATLAFDAAFNLFHELLFPGGNYTFDPATQRLVQLYPYSFWQMSALAIGVLLIAFCGLTWLFARRRSMEESA